MKIKPITYFFAAALLLMSFSSKEGEKRSKINVNENYRVSELLTKHEGFLRDLKKIEGYRIQLGKAGSRNEAYDLQKNFITKSNIRVYIHFDAPDYKVRAGDFQTKVQAFKWLMLLRDQFPQAVIVTDLINVSEL